MAFHFPLYLSFMEITQEMKCWNFPCNTLDISALAAEEKYHLSINCFVPGLY